MKANTTKRRLFFTLFAIILLPFLQHVFNVIESGGLQGAMESHSNATFTPANWWNGTYQQQKTAFLNDSVGFRPDMVRLTNQVNFWLFKILPCATYVGKNGYLFNREYIDEYEGRYNPDTNKIRMSLQKLKKLQDTLEHEGKTFLFIFAPSKPYFMPDNIPYVLRRSSGRLPTNYQVFRPLADSFKIKTIDFNKLFLAMKDTSKEPLFAKYGMHWSLYGSLLASDSIVRWVERERNIDMPHLVITKLLHPDTVIHPDNDLAKCSNLVFPLKRERLCYPEYHYEQDSAKKKLNMIFIGDSFGGQWITNRFPQSISSHWEYWYYFKAVWNEQNMFNSNIPMESYNWQSSVANADCIITIFTPTNYPFLAMDTSSFIHQMYKFYFGKNS